MGIKLKSIISRMHFGAFVIWKTSLDYNIPQYIVFIYLFILCFEFKGMFPEEEFMERNTFYECETRKFEKG